MIETILSIATFIGIYCMSSFIADKVMLGQYQWFSNLEDKMCEKFPKRQTLINKIFSFKLFWCNACLTFWTSLLMLSSFSFVAPISIIDVIESSLIIYLIRVNRDGQEPKDNE